MLKYEIKEWFLDDGEYSYYHKYFYQYYSWLYFLKYFLKFS